MISARFFESKLMRMVGLIVRQMLALPSVVCRMARLDGYKGSTAGCHIFLFGIFFLYIRYSDYTKCRHTCI